MDDYNNSTQIGSQVLAENICTTSNQFPEQAGFRKSSTHCFCHYYRKSWLCFTFGYRDTSLRKIGITLLSQTEIYESGFDTSAHAGKAPFSRNTSMKGLYKQAKLPLHTQIWLQVQAARTCKQYVHGDKADSLHARSKATHSATSQVHNHFACKLIVGIVHLQGC